MMRDFEGTIVFHVSSSSYDIHVSSSMQRMMRDFQGTIVEGAKEAITEEAPRALASSAALRAPHVAQAYWVYIYVYIRMYIHTYTYIHTYRRS